MLRSLDCVGAEPSSCRAMETKVPLFNIPAELIQLSFNFSAAREGHDKAKQTEAWIKPDLKLSTH